jgi:protein TonB
MFNALESNWNQSAHRGWTTLASFTMQALGLSLLLAIPLIWVQRPPQLHWLQPLASPAAPAPPAPTPGAGHQRTASTRNSIQQQFIAPASIPVTIAMNDSASVPSAPDLSQIGSGPGHERGTVPGGLGDGNPVVIPPRPVAIKPLVVSDLGEGSLLHRVQPTYPPIAREARVQGAVELRAIISKTGTIENLVVVSGQPMLVKSAIDAVRQWRYRPYILNHEPIEVETEITVNFLLSGG